MYEAIIIGGGPAGLSAAIYLARQKVKFALLAGNFGGQAAWSSDIENYLGLHGLSGQQIADKFREHLDDYKNDFDLKEGEMVEKIERLDKGFRVKTSAGEYEATTVLVATGAKHRELGVPGEKEFYGKGLTYCATCDAPLFRDKKVHVIGGGNSAMDAALFLIKYASAITLVSLNTELKGDDSLMSRVMSDPKIKILFSTKTLRIEGETLVKGIALMGPDGQERVEETQGVFVEIGLKPVADFADFAAKDKYGQIVTDKTNATDVPGFYAAGDVTDVPEKQVSVAVGEGAKAALSIIKYLQKNK